MSYQPLTGHPCTCKRGQQRDNCPQCEGTGMQIDFAQFHKDKPKQPLTVKQIASMIAPKYRGSL